MSSSPAVTMEPAASSYGSRAASCLADGWAFPQSDRETALCLPFPKGDCREIESRRCRHTLRTLPTVSFQMHI